MVKRLETDFIIIPPLYVSGPPAKTPVYHALLIQRLSYYIGMQLEDTYPYLIHP